MVLVANNRNPLDVNSMIGRTLARIMDERGWSQLEMGRKAKVPNTTISSIIRRNRATTDVTAKLARALGVTTDELIFGKAPERPLPAAAQTIAVYAASNTHPELIDAKSYEALPLVNTPAALGAGRIVHENEVEDHVIVKAHMLRGRKGNLKAIWVKGESMEPVLSDGDIVAIEERPPDLEWSEKELNGAIVAARVNLPDPESEIVVKRLEFIRGSQTHVYLRAENREWERQRGGPLIVKRRDFLIAGKVLWAWRKFTT